MRRGALLLIATGCGRIGFDPGARVGDGSPDVAPPACTALFCDGFEDVALAAWSGKLVENGSSADHFPDFGFHGSSLKAFAPGGSAVAARYVDVFPAQPPAEAWVRAYVYAPSGATLDLEPVAIANAADTVHLVFSLYDDSFDIHAHGIAGDFGLDETMAPPRDRWVCYELHVAIGAAGAVELYRDGALVLAQPNLDTRPADDLSRVLVGIVSKPTQPTAAIHVDEIAIDTRRPGCL